MASQNTPRSTAAACEPELAGLPLLIVDDEAEILELLCAVLTDEGFTVFTASNASAALALIRRAPVALVLTDLMMPGGTGLDLAQQLRREPQTAAIPLILMSAAMPAHVSDMFAHVLHKPFSIDVVVDMVHQSLAQ